MHKLLWVTPRWPLPAEDGARQATCQLVRGLVAQGCEVEIVVIARPEEIGDEQKIVQALGVRRVIVVKRQKPRHLLNALLRPWQGITFAPYLTAAVTQEIQAAYEAMPGCTVVVADGLHAAAWYTRLARADRERIPLILRAHNIEANLWRQGARQRAFPFSMLLRFQAGRVASLERKICTQARLVATVSENDRQGLALLAPQTPMTVTPIGIPESAASATFPDRRRLLFVGRLDWAPNREGLRWFLQNVWPTLATEDNDLSLTIAGTGDGAWLQPYLDLPRLKFLGRVPDLAPLYSECAISLAPIFFGSGTRVKVIESSGFSRACLSTEIGVEGIGLDPADTYFRAETAAEWIQALRTFSLPEARARGQAARRKISENFDPRRIAEDLITATSAALA